MTSLEPQLNAHPPPSPFQFDLRTLLLLFVVAASSMAVFGAWGILVFVLTLGLAVYLRNVEVLPGWFEIIALALVLAVLIALLLPGVRAARESGRRAACSNNLKQLALALIAYDQAHGSLPPAYSVDNSGRPLQSWRTQILPEVERTDLYKACDFTRPWDAPTNKAILGTPVRIFVCPSDPPGGSRIASTSYFAVVGPNTAWGGDKPCKLADLGKEVGHTVLLVETAGAGIQWAEPKDISLDELCSNFGNPLAKRLSSYHFPLNKNFFHANDDVSCINVALADGRVTVLRTDNLSPENLRKLFEIGGFTDEVQACQTNPYAAERFNWPNISALAVWIVSVGTLLTAAVRGRAARIVKEQTAVAVDAPARS